jgi:dihydrofolate synthase/folylpolyglutamate synthase
MIHGRAPHGGADPASVAREEGALTWLFSFADMERGVGWNPASSPAEQWKLGRTRALLDAAGAPDRRMRVVLIAGTKGKGSTAASLAALLSKAGVRAGLYTQPHLQSYRERIRVDGEAISADDLGALVERWRTVVERVALRHPDAGLPTTFEITTAMSLGHFVESGCAVAVLEVGLGGRLDATNATDPEISIVCTIDRGHTEILGTRIDAIAREKAGILRAGRVALLARQRPLAARALARACRVTGARCRTVEPLDPSVPLALRGVSQLQNAALAVAATRELGVAADLMALRALGWPGRMESPDLGWPVLLDGAHDAVSARALADELVTRSAGDIELVIGMYRDKEATRILRPLLPLAHRVWATAPLGPRALPATELSRACRRIARVPLEVRPDLRAAIDDSRAGSDGRLVVITGSLALVGQARDHLGLPVVERLWPRAAGTGA